MKKQTRPNPDSVKGLRWEQKQLRSIAEECASGFPMNMHVGSSRRKAIGKLLKLMGHPQVHKLNKDVLYAAVFLCEYNDRLAGQVLQSVVQDYDSYVAELKERRKHA